LEQQLWSNAQPLAAKLGRLLLPERGHPEARSLTLLTMLLARFANAKVWAVWLACSSAALTFAMITALQLPPIESCTAARHDEVPVQGVEVFLCVP
jgi:hypothetical protein